MSSSEDHTVKVWDAGSGDELLSLRHEDRVNAAAWSPDGRRLATAGHNEDLLKIWDASAAYEAEP